MRNEPCLDQPEPESVSAKTLQLAVALTDRCVRAMTELRSAEDSETCVIWGDDQHRHAFQDLRRLGLVTREPDGTATLLESGHRALAAREDAEDPESEHHPLLAWARLPKPAADMLQIVARAGEIRFSAHTHDNYVIRLAGLVDKVKIGPKHLVLRATDLGMRVAQAGARR